MCIRFVSFNDCSIGFWNCFDSVLFSVFHLVVRQPLHGLFQKLLTIPEHMMSSIFLVGFILLGLFLCGVFLNIVCFFTLILLPIVLSVFNVWLLINPFGISKAFTMFVYQQYFFITMWAFQWELSVHLWLFIFTVDLQKEYWAQIYLLTTIDIDT